MNVAYSDAYSAAEALFRTFPRGWLCWAAGMPNISGGKPARNHVYRAFGFGHRTGEILCGKGFQADLVPTGDVPVCALCARHLAKIAQAEVSAQRFRPAQLRQEIEDRRAASYAR